MNIFRTYSTNTLPKLVFLFFFCLFMFILTSQLGRAHAFGTTGCEGDCKKCHTLSTQEAQNIIKKLKLNAKITNIQLGPIKSLWEVSLDDKGKKALLYIDFSKKYIMPGPIIEVNTGANKTAAKLESMGSTKKTVKIDVSKIPLANAMIMGNKKAQRKVIIFTDPDCPFCKNLHQEIKNVLQKRKDIAFYIKLYPLVSIHKDAYWKSKSIICNNKSLKMLEDNFDKKTIARKECSTKEIDENIKLMESYGISGSPTIIFPNGIAHTGTLPADELIKLIDKNAK